MEKDPRIERVAKVVYVQRWLIKKHGKTEEQISGMWAEADDAVKASCLDEAEEFLQRLDAALAAADGN